MSDLYRQVPLLNATNPLRNYETDKEKSDKCSKTDGHVLKVEGEYIRCIHCPSKWRKYGC